MCMEDIRIGRKGRAITRLVPLTQNVATTVATPNPRRIRLFFSGPVGFNSYLAPEGFTPANQVGIALVQPQLSIWFKIEDFGLGVTGRWQAFTGGAGQFMVVTDVTLEED